MDMIQSPHARLEKPVASARRRNAKFSGALLEREGAKENFINPVQEAELILPEHNVNLAPIAIEARGSVFAQEAAVSLPGMARKKARKTEGLFTSVYEYLLFIFNNFKRMLYGSTRRRVKLTKKGEEALEQLRYLSLLCDATEYRTPDQILAIEAVFGEAYYEIMTLSGNLQRMSVSEQEHHVRNYSKQMEKLLKSTDLEI